MLKMYDDKKKKEEEELSKKDKVSSMITKDSVKKEDEKEEEKPDMRSKYAMINLIKNKLRSAGQRDPMVMAVDACEERTPAKDDPSFSQEYKDNAKKAIKASKNKKKKAAPSYNIPTADNPKGGLRKKNDPKTYPSGIGEGP